MEDRGLQCSFYLSVQLVGALVFIQPASAGDVLMRLSTGSVNGVYYHIGVELCREINKRRHDHGVWCAVEASKGSEENLERLLLGNAELAIAQSDTVGKFSQEGGQISVIASLYREMLHAFVRPGVAVQSFDDLRGKSVNIGERGSGTRSVVENVLQYFSLDPDSFALNLELAPTEQAEYVCSGRVDVSFWMAAVPNPVGDELTSSCSAELLSFRPEEAQGLSSSHDLSIGHITRDHYVTVTEPVVTLQVNALLVASPQLPLEEVSRVVEILLHSQESLRRSSRFLGTLAFE